MKKLSRFAVLLCVVYTFFGILGGVARAEGADSEASSVTVVDHGCRPRPSCYDW